MRVLVLLAAVAVAAACDRVSYDGYQVWRLADVRPEQREGLLHAIQNQKLDVWGRGLDWVDVMVSPEQRDASLEALALIGAHSRVMIPNVQSLVERDYKALDSRKTSDKVSFTFDEYHTYEEIQDYLKSLPEQDDRTSLKSLGQTVEKRDLWQLKISVGSGKTPVWLDCGIHAREWISPATCLWGINYLLTGYGNDKNVTDFLDKFDMYIMPVNNPDGYAYTQTDRMWRKNRNRPEGNACIGIDLNRNFDDHFGGPGTSGDSCSGEYRGPSAASELEIQATQAGIRELSAEKAIAMFSLHSYSQLWMYPFGWTGTPAPEADELDKNSKIGVEALTAVHGTKYQYGSIYETIYPAASTTVDFSYSAGIVFSYTLELRDTGEFGFLLPEREIVPNSEEAWAGMINSIETIPRHG